MLVFATDVAGALQLGPIRPYPELCLPRLVAGAIRFLRLTPVHSSQR